METSAREARDPLVVALDIGTSSVRAALVDATGARLPDGAKRAYAMTVAPDGSVTVGAETLHAAVADALDRLTARAGPSLRRASAVAISTFMHSIVPLARDGRPLGPVLSWADTTSSDDARRLRRELDADDVFERTGAPLHASYWAPRLRSLRARYGPRIARWAGAPDVIVERLTGRSAVDVSLAAATGLLDRRTGAWEAALLAHLGIAAETLPAISDGRPVADALAPDAAARWPGLAGLAWFAPWADGACSNVGLGARGAGRAALMIGTSSAMRAILPQAAPTVQRGLFAFRLRDGCLVGGQLSEGGGLASWARALTGRSLAALEREAAAVEPDSHGLTLLPHLAGERGPGYHDRARGVVAGISLATGAAHLYRALLEAVALRLALTDGALSRALGTRPAISATGGALKGSPLWAGIVADALGRDIELSPVVEASLRGAALLAHEALGTAVPVDLPSGMTIAADVARHERYAAALARQEELYARILG